MSEMRITSWLWREQVQPLLLLPIVPLIVVSVKRLLECCTEKDKKDSPVPRRWIWWANPNLSSIIQQWREEGWFYKGKFCFIYFQGWCFFSLYTFKVGSRCTPEIINKLSNYFLKSLEGKKIQNLQLILFTLNKKFGTQTHNLNQSKKVTIVQSLTINAIMQLFISF